VGVDISLSRLFITPEKIRIKIKKVYLSFRKHEVNSQKEKILEISKARTY
jgi:hypothetical protein